MRERTILPPSGHPTVDEPGIASEAGIGPESETFGDAGPVSLDENVGVFDEFERGGEAVGTLQIEGQHPLPTLESVEARVDGHGEARTRPFDTDDIGALVG